MPIDGGSAGSEHLPLVFIMLWGRPVAEGSASLSLMETPRLQAGRGRAELLWVGFVGAEKEEHLALAQVRKVTCGDMEPQLNHALWDGACGMGSSPGEIPRDKLEQAGSILGAA